MNSQAAVQANKVTLEAFMWNENTLAYPIRTRARATLADIILNVNL